jgi:tRNA-dihydrouridine synthase A
MGGLIAVAPMMGWTDRHCRYFLRLLTPRALLYSEMITTDAILRGKRECLLQFEPAEHALALQLGGCDPLALAECAKIAEAYGYDEINLNVGCPSDRVQLGRFGACLMAEPDLVARCIAAMQAAVKIPVTVKTRIGIDQRDSYAELCDFVQTVADAGCQTFIIHARKAWLKGLSPKENREIPPLRYDVVGQIKKDFPALTIVINGGITHLDQAAALLTEFDGVMIGRAAYHNPCLLIALEQLFDKTGEQPLERALILQKYISYVERQLDAGVALSCLARPIFGLFHGVSGANAWRRYLSEHVHRPGSGSDVLQAALAATEQHK